MLNNFIQQNVTRHSLQLSIHSELRALATHCCHPQELARSYASNTLNSLIAAFPSILCESSLVTHLLEILTLLQEACESRYLDMVSGSKFPLEILMTDLCNAQYYPVFQFRSQRIDLSITLPEDSTLREHILTTMLRNVRSWFTASLGRTPMETRNLLQVCFCPHLLFRGGDKNASQEYLNAPTSTTAYAEGSLGRSVALELTRTAPAGSREGECHSIAQRHLLIDH